MAQSKECHNMRLYKETRDIEISYVYRKDLRLGELISQTILNIRESEEMNSVYKNGFTCLTVWQTKQLFHNSILTISVEYFSS